MLSPARFLARPEKAITYHLTPITLSPSPPAAEAWGAALAKVGIHYQQALDLEKGKNRQKLLEDIRTNIWNYYPDADILGKIGLEE